MARSLFVSPCLILLFSGALPQMVLAQGRRRAPEQINPAMIPESAYVVARDGQLYVRGERVRFWGVVGNFPGKNHADNRAVVRRLKNLGFNMVRYWRGFPEPVDYTKGDGSRTDLIDHFVYCMKQEGMYIWNAGFGGAVGRAVRDDANVIDDPATAKAWQEAVGQDGLTLTGREMLARTWDPRLEAIALRHMRNTAEHFNQWTGLRWGDDPVFAVWELSNEEWWFERMMGGYAFWAPDRTSLFPKLPAFLQGELIKQWNAFLRRKYRSEAALREAWLGLLPGESFTEGTVLLAPFRQAESVEGQADVLGLKEPRLRERTFGPSDFNASRSSDVIEFLISVWVAHKQREEKAVRRFGRAVENCPLVYDTGRGFSLPSQYMLQQGDAIAQVNYLRGFTHDPMHERFPWYSFLQRAPRLGWDTPQLEHNTAPGMPFFVYETQIEQPAKYRAEYPLRLAAMASANDWDIVIWHYFGIVPDSTEERPYDRAMDYTTSERGHPQGLHFQYDEVQMAMMRLAGDLFRNELLAPGKVETRFTFGRKSLYDLQMSRYGRGTVARQLRATPMRHISRLWVDPQQEGDSVEGPVVRGPEFMPNPTRPTPQISFDRHRGHLKLDAPGAAVYAGFFGLHGGPVRFDSGVTLRDVQVVNPPKMPYPVGKDRFVCVGLVSQDGRSLEKADRVVVSAVSTSFNSGFQLDHEKFARELLWQWNPGVTVSVGKAPVLVARVGVTIEAPAIDGMRYRMLDWHLNVIAEGTVTDGRLRVPANRPVFLVELVRK